MKTRVLSILIAVFAFGLLVSGCGVAGGNDTFSNVPLEISLNQLVGSWESQAQSVGRTGYFYQFNEDGSLSLSEETAENLVLNGSFAITDGTSLDIELRNPKDNAVILTMVWQLINVEPTELVFRTVPDEAIIWLKRVN